MRVRHVSIIPTQQAQKSRRIGLTPELLAATGARYSRSNEGLDTIVSRIDWSNIDRSVDSIFRMVDYGHASIADMAPVAMFIDGISLYAAYYLWSQCATASGQESSTRYIRLTKDGVMRPHDLGIREEGRYYEEVARTFVSYDQALQLWTHYTSTHPEVMHLPKELLLDTSPAGTRKRDRIVRNYAFDRARVFLPVCARTNVMLLMSARSWVDLISTLLSHPLLEFQKLGEQIRNELKLVTPRLIKHAVYKPDSAAVIAHTMERLQNHHPVDTAGDGAHLNLYGSRPDGLARLVASRTGRYSMCADEIRGIPVRFGWRHVTFAEMRDLNRHRTGQKVSILYPNGFYNASDETRDDSMRSQLDKLSRDAHRRSLRMIKLINKGDERYFYHSLLGHMYEFEHVTTLDKFIYEAELRTGVGAHYRYALHLRNCLHILYRRHPELRGKLFEGSAEPE